ncbi:MULTISPECIES: hypothetical protein [Paenibacillus]|uniref:Uncharacterized protein n=1 Tax=Paenibacillus naphthalenovorans TaxID=162209 RepID=A0A0U2M3M5_9BACL|nr:MULTISPECIES: hypothetical protein [Paenibacillus]ALS22000.1 hypothetical protein IJ22_16240 [Paenibacillus naphthalenovorans]NTZ16732.1 hypothetical protein [Paenibacillus sp. JMULE4]GCL74218.1 hypothetical protein PN4B1_41640 [Paenibacillus naphthalenovorans]SDJ23880.1 hypothetical protein SAMN05421868_12132 [Paenibacillus naphthalenovorans]
MNSRKLEEELAQKLTEGQMEQEDTKEAARKRLPIKTEIRIQAQIDPVLEETRRFRQMASEVDDRYAKYDRLVNESKDKEEQ